MLKYIYKNGIVKSLWALWWSVSLVEEAGVPKENNRSATIIEQLTILSHDMVLSTTHNELESKSQL